MNKTPYQFLDDMAESQGIEQAIDKFRHMLFSTHLIIFKLENENKISSNFSLEDVKERLKSLIDWKIQNKNEILRHRKEIV
jgi:Trm5-related predicted tRNA methylase